ncbi:MAG: GNAT family N-acetyltransferase [Vitreoscilla sp.]|nr:GNAT family N-acetyltransferase [Vitreoscilla sp.]
MDHHTLIHAPRHIDTPRLRLEAPARHHAPAVHDSVNTSLSTLGFIAWAQAPWTLERAERFCDGGLKMVDAGECLVFNAFRRDDGAFVGRIDLHTFDFEAPRAEIGYVGDVRQAGQGLMREAVLAVVALGFELGLARVEAISEVENERALHFAETMGFTREGRLHHRERDARGELCDQVLFAVFPPVVSPSR